MTSLIASRADQDTDFVDKVKYFIVKAAVSIVSEASSASLHTQRVALARQIVGNPASFAIKFAVAVMTNSTLFAAVSFAAIADNDLETAVNSVYNAFIPV